MIGRYGPDQLNILLLILAVIFGLIASITGLLVFSIISYIITTRDTPLKSKSFNEDELKDKV